MKANLNRALCIALLACLAASFSSAHSLACIPDVTGNSEVDVDDLLAVINTWGPCDALPTACPADIAPDGGNSVVDVDDLLMVINAWGPCITTPTCDKLSWLPTFGGVPGVGGGVFALTVFDDGLGGGPALYAGGDFKVAGGFPVNNIAKWNGTSWSPLGSGTSDLVLSLAVFDDGSGGGPALYAGGYFNTAGGVSANHIAKWDGTSWSPLGLGTFGVGGGYYGEVYALAVFDDGSGDGPALYAGGGFEWAGGEYTGSIAKWDGTSWSPVGEGLGGGPVFSLAVFDDGSGSGPALYAGGGFQAIAKWNGAAWSTLDTGVWGHVLAMSVFDDGSGGGPALYAAGSLGGAGAITTNNIVKWNGSTWSDVGGGTENTFDRINALTVFDDGSGGGPALYAGGFFDAVGGVRAQNIARWNGTSWSALDSGVGGDQSSEVYSLTVFDDGSGGGPALFAGGYFNIAGSAVAYGIAKWNPDSSEWSELGSPTIGIYVQIDALAVFDDGSGDGPALYAGGFFTVADGITVNRIAKWNGTSWSALGSGFNNSVRALAVFDDGSGSGPELYAGGFFTAAGEVSANYIAKWNGTTWSPVGSGMNNMVASFTVFDDGSGGGPALYAGGTFTTAGGVSANCIAKWNGTSWSPLGSGLTGVVSSAYAMTVFDDGGGPALYAGGYFTFAGGVQVNRIAKWNGSFWSKLGVGVGSGTSNFVNALATLDDGSGAGPSLYVGGSFTTAGGQPANRIARWNGTSWSPLGSGLSNRPYALIAFDDGLQSGPALYAGGIFTIADGLNANHIAKWNGLSWSTLDSGVTDSVGAFSVFDDGLGGGPALHAAGSFFGSPAGDSFLAKWGCPGTK